MALVASEGGGNCENFLIKRINDNNHKSEGI